MIGIDTAHLKFLIEIPIYLLDLHWKTVMTRTRENIWIYSYYRTEYINEAKIFFEYFPISYNSLPLLVIQISSLPKLLYGSNFIPIYNLDEAIHSLNMVFATLLPGIMIDIGVGVFERVDFFYDYYVGNFRFDYLKAIAQVFYPHRTRCVFLNRSTRNKNKNDNGVWFKSKGAIAKFYDKGLESGDWIADGYLRHECELLDTSEVRRATGLEVPTLSEITPEIVFNALKRDLVRLGLWQTSIMGKECSLRMMQATYGSRQAKRLANLLRDIHDNPQMNKEELAKLNGIKLPALNKSLRQINAAGTVTGNIDGELTLPPLDLRIANNQLCGIVTKTPSDTVKYDSTNVVDGMTNDKPDIMKPSNFCTLPTETGSYNKSPFSLFSNGKE